MLDPEKHTTKPPIDDPTLSERQKAETRFWLQVLDINKLIYGDLNAALSENFGLSVAKFDVLAQLYRQPEGVSMGDLSKHLRVSNGNVSGLITRLRLDGLVTRQVTKTDRRSFLASLTDKGRNIFEDANALHRAVVSQKLQNIPLSDIHAVTAGLRAMASKTKRPLEEMPR